MKGKGKRIVALEQEVANVNERLTALVNEYRGNQQALAKAQQDVATLRREIDAYAKQQQELAWEFRQFLAGKVAEETPQA